MRGMWVCVSVLGFLSVCQWLGVCVCGCVCGFACVFVCLSIYVCVEVSVFVFVCLNLFLWVWVTVCGSVSVFVGRCPYLSLSFSQSESCWDQCCYFLTSPLGTIHQVRSPGWAWSFFITWIRPFVMVPFLFFAVHRLSKKCHYISIEWLGRVVPKFPLKFLSVFGN